MSKKDLEKKIKKDLEKKLEKLLPEFMQINFMTADYDRIYFRAYTKRVIFHIIEYIWSDKPCLLIYKIKASKLLRKKL